MPLKIEHHIVLDSSPALCKLIDAITGDERVKELENQMDSWLATLEQSIGKVETVSEQVDSKK